jgi:microcin C transport system substrate-binding protein
LLAAAGWIQVGNSVVDDEGAPLEVEFLIESSSLERILSPYVQSLKLIGVNAWIRQVDPVQMQSRENDYDFDVVMSAVSLDATPLDGLQQLFGSAAAATPGTYNLAGIREPVVDALIARLPTVQSREELITITRAIDRILRAKHYWVSNWYRPSHNVAHWDIFGWTEDKPDYAFTPETTWWFDADKAAKIGYRA